LGSRVEQLGDVRGRRRVDLQLDNAPELQGLRKVESAVPVTPDGMKQERAALRRSPFFDFDMID
jgi:hypothetical protein